jgi:hypothetical protein
MLNLDWGDVVKPKLIIFSLLFLAALAAGVLLLRPPGKSAPPEPPQPEPTIAAEPSEPPFPTPRTSSVPRIPPVGVVRPRLEPPPETAPTTTNKVARLAQLREDFRAFAAGDPKAALVAAKQLTNDVERETALLALATEWTHGELGSPRQRAQAIAQYGLEAGLGMAFAKNTDLALLWANELTEGSARTALLQQTAVEMVASDPAGAFALGQQLAPAEQRQFFNSLFAGWAGNDTDAALSWAAQLPEAERDAALQAIRSAAPVGIGAVLSVQEGYPVINDLLAGAPGALSGQLNKGDRIVALAQGNNSFVDTRNLPLADVVQMIRGAPGTLLQLQVVSADAPLGSAPRTVSILRDQVKFKR